MTIKIESVINQWDSETDEVIIRFLNLLTLAKTRRELEQALDFSPFKEQFRNSCLNLKPSLVAHLSDLIAAVAGCAAVVAEDKAVEAAGSAEAAASGYFGKSEGGEAQKVVDEAQAVGYTEIMAGLAGEAADEAAKVTVGTAKAVGNVFQAILPCRKRLQQMVGGIEASRMEIPLQRAIDCLPVLIVMTNGCKWRDIHFIECLVSFFFVHSSETFT